MATEDEVRRVVWYLPFVPVIRFTREDLGKDIDAGRYDFLLVERQQRRDVGWWVRVKRWGGVVKL